MVFCESRKCGVRGILFGDFFAGLHGKLQEMYKPMELAIGATKEKPAASKLWAEYKPLKKLFDMMIPFVAPPNAVWQQCILETLATKAATDGTRGGVYVKDMDNPRFLFVNANRHDEGGTLRAGCCVGDKVGGCAGVLCETGEL